MPPITVLIIPICYTKRVRWWEHTKHKNLILLALSILFGLVLSRLEPFHELLLHLDGFGYVSAFLAGMLFVSTFTLTTGAVMLLVLAERYSAIEIGLIAGMGAVLGDYVVYHFIKYTFIDEITFLFEKLGGDHIRHVFHTKYFSWTLPVIGALIIASPLPDELGVSLMGISKMKPYQFLLVSFILNAVGIFLIVSASVVIKP